MSLSTDLISQFVKVTRDENKKPSEATVYGTVSEQEGYVLLDGSSVLTPVRSTVKMKSGERVLVQIKDHSAVVTGNLTTRSARSDDVDDIVDEIAEFEIIIADKVSVSDLDAERARIDDLVADNVVIRDRLTASEAVISELEADNVTINGTLTAHEAEITKLSTGKLDADFAEITYATIADLDATNATIVNLEATYGDFVVLTTDKFTAVEATISDLEVNKLSAEDAEFQYANIDFANIGDAAIENLFSKSGIIGDMVISNGAVTGTLVGVTIKGDLIEGGTIVADKLVVQGEDGLYYKLNVSGETVEAEQTEYNSLNGSIITAKSITANKINVDDLVAFDATIGGFKITDHSLYSGVKESASNTTRGVYLGDDGQVAFGDASNFLKYYRDQNGAYHLDISASSLRFASSGKSVEEVFDDIEVGARNLIRNSKTLLFEEYGFHSDIYAVDVDIVDGVLILTAYSPDDSAFTVENVDDVLYISEQTTKTLEYPLTIVEGEVVTDSGFHNQSSAFVHATADVTPGDTIEITGYQWSVEYGYSLGIFYDADGNVISTIVADTAGARTVETVVPENAVSLLVNGHTQVGTISVTGRYEAEATVGAEIAGDIFIAK